MRKSLKISVFVAVTAIVGSAAAVFVSSAPVSGDPPLDPLKAQHITDEQSHHDLAVLGRIDAPKIPSLASTCSGTAVSNGIAPYQDSLHESFINVGSGTTSSGGAYRIYAGSRAARPSQGLLQVYKLPSNPCGDNQTDEYEGQFDVGQAQGPVQLTALSGDVARFTYTQTGCTGTFNIETQATTQLCDSFIPLAPVRLIDSRTTPGAHTLTGQESFVLQVGGVGGVPSDAVAVVGTLTAVQPQVSTFLTAYPNDVGLPNTSNVVAQANEVVSNMVVVRLAADGRIKVYNNTGLTNFILDVTGYYTPLVATSFVPVSTRVLDTRPSAVGAFSNLRVPIFNTGGMGTDADSVVANIVVISPQTNGYTTVYSGTSSRPNTSSSQFGAGQTVSNLATVKVGTDGYLNLYNGSSGTIQVVVDLQGYYKTGSSGQEFAAMNPVRLADTRDPSYNSKLYAGWVYDTASVFSRGVPTNATAVLVNICAVDTGGASFFTVYPNGSALPPTSNLNIYYTGDTICNAAITTVPANGMLKLYNQNASTHMIMDILGYFVP